jgi:membrane protein implicated in regulation of membrane protease activity
MILDDIGMYWLVTGAFLIIFELSFVPGIGLLFAGLGAISCGALISWGFVDEQYYDLQMLWFFTITIIWAICLWLPFKRFRYRKSTDSFNNMIGSSAVVVSNDLKKGEIGTVKWSGTVMNAKIDSNCPQDLMAVGTNVVIKNVQGNVLIIEL